MWDFDSHLLLVSVKLMSYHYFVAVDLEADISQLQAPTFTTINRGPPEPMLHLSWSLPVNLIGEKVLNPMIHCCDKCLKPILIYGRLVSLSKTSFKWTTTLIQISVVRFLANTCFVWAVDGKRSTNRARGAVKEWQEWNKPVSDKCLCAHMVDRATETTDVDELISRSEIYKHT